MVDKETRMISLRRFEETMKDAMKGLLEFRVIEQPRRKNQTHYAIPGNMKMLSVTPEEGCILFSIARTLQPTHIVEFGTGTGASTAYLAAGAHNARVTTIDHFKEAGSNPELVNELWIRLGMRERITLFVEFIEHVDDDNLIGSLFFLDGYAKAGMQRRLLNKLPPKTVLIEHDTAHLGERLMSWHVGIPSLSQLSLHGDDRPQLDMLHNLATIFCDG